MSRSPKGVVCCACCVVMRTVRSKEGCGFCDYHKACKSSTADFSNLAKKSADLPIQSMIEWWNCGTMLTSTPFTPLGSSATITVITLLWNTVLWCRLWGYEVWLIHSRAFVPLSTTHQVIVTFHSYSNPSGRCAECNGAISTAPACCDAPTAVPQSQSCPTDDTCDTALMYCYRAVGTIGSLCNQPNLAPIAVLNGNESLDSSQDFFGLRNPFIQDRFGPWQVRGYLTSSPGLLL